MRMRELRIFSGLRTFSDLRMFYGGGARIYNFDILIFAWLVVFLSKSRRHHYR